MMPDPLKFTFWTNLFFTVPAIIAFLKSQFIHSEQLMLMMTASMFMHYKFGTTVAGMTSIQRFLWDNFASLLSMYFATTYVVSSGHVNPIATLTCVHVLVFICSMMVAHEVWDGKLNNIGIGLSLVLAFIQFNPALYTFQWQQVVAVICIAIGVINLWLVKDKWWSHGVWHISAALCFTFAYLNKCDTDRWLIPI